MQLYITMNMLLTRTSLKLNGSLQAMGILRKLLRTILNPTFAIPLARFDYVEVILCQFGNITEKHSTTEPKNIHINAVFSLPTFPTNVLKTGISSTLNPPILFIYIIITLISVQMEEVSTNSVRSSLLCQNSHEADLVCCSTACKRYSFMCRTKDCKCLSQFHRNCVYRSLDGLLEDIYSKKGKTTESDQKSFNILIKIYRQAIQRLSKDLDDLITKMSVFGLKNNQSKFVKLIQEGKFSQITGELMSEVNKQVQIKDQLRLLPQEQITRYWETKSKQFDKICDSLRLITQENKQFIFQSKILDNLILINQFFQKPIKKLNFLYRASQNNFQVSAFHKQCDGVPNTLILIRTQYDRIIGGFSHKTWNCVTDQKFSPDPSLKTFLFSVTNRQKYPLIKNDSGIGCYANYGPIFGSQSGCDLVIANHANTNRTSHNANFPLSFTNGKYTKNQATYTSFSGSPNDYNFTIKEWEVYEVIM